MAAVEMQMHGLDELYAKLEKLGDTKVTKRISRKAARQAMNIVRNAAREKAKALDDPGTNNKIWKQIVVQAGKSRNKNEIVMRVGVKGGARVPYTNNAQNRRLGRVGKTYKTDGHHFYWRFLEFGTAHMPAVPFMRPAFAQNVQAATDKFAQFFMSELDKELDKL